MQHTDLIILLGLGSSLVMPALYKSRESIRGLLGGACYRTELKGRLAHSRYGSMLKKRGIDLQYYLFSQSAFAIESQINDCETCDSTHKCDYFTGNDLPQRHVDPVFCRINDSILDIKDRQDKLFH